MERLANGNTLITDVHDDRVIEVDNGGTIVWEYVTGLDGPWDAERLANGNTLITDSYNNRVIEVDSDGVIVWQKTRLYYPVDAERLANGNTLISEIGNTRVIEVSPWGWIVWEYATGLDQAWDAERLANGNTLIADPYNFRVIEVDSNGTIVWVKTGLTGPDDVERLPNGNTLITESYIYRNRVFEVNRDGMIVWEIAGMDVPIDAERISNPPDIPTIDGRTRGGVLKEYEYTFNAIDPDGDNVKYYIDWGGNYTEWTGYNPSGTDVKVKHKWRMIGVFTIKARAVDSYGAMSDWGTFKVIMPKDKPFSFTFNLFDWLFDRFPLLEVFLRAMNLLR